jgi:Protein of unknown function (DUF3631)
VAPALDLDSLALRVAVVVSPFDRVVAALEARGSRRAGHDWQCPAHDDEVPSLSVTAAKDKVLVHCQVGCSVEEVVSALGLSMADLFTDDGKLDSRVEVARYDYTDEGGGLLFQVVRFVPKDFRQRRPDGTGWAWNLNGTRRVPYRLPAVVQAVRDGRRIYVVEGEKDVHSIERAGGVATCNPGGAGKWREEFRTYFEGARHDVIGVVDNIAAPSVVVVADADEPGRKHARAVAASLRVAVQDVRVVSPKAGKDASDHLAAGFGLDDFEPVRDEDLGAVLDDVRALLVEHVAFPSEGAADAVTLWAEHAHAVAAFESTPRLALLSPEKQTGKTRTLEMLDQLVPAPMHAVNCTSAALFRAVAVKRPTLLFDEADTYFGLRTRSEHEELRGLVNAGHRRGAVAYRVVGDGAKLEVREFPAFAPVALAGIGELPETILDRAVVIRMRRRAPDEQVTPFRLRKVKPRAESLRERMAAWAQSHREQLTEAEPEMPAGITDRPADVWEALLAIADAAGGDWPARARAAAVELEAGRAEATPSRGIQLLGDIRTVFDAADADRLSTENLCARLAAMEESPWGDLKGHTIDARGLAYRLRPYGVHPHVVRIGDKTSRGYQLSDFADPWNRYLPHPSPDATSVTDSPSATQTGALTSDVTAVTHVADMGEGKGVVTHAGPQQAREEAEPDREDVETLLRSCRFLQATIGRVTVGPGEAAWAAFLDHTRVPLGEVYAALERLVEATE